MKNNKIGEMLKLYRKQNQLSVSDVCIQLKEQFGMEVAEKTVYGWESNQAHPTADTFVAVCELYHVDSISALYQNPNSQPPIPLTEEEVELVLNYRNAPALQVAVHKILDMKLRKRSSATRMGLPTDRKDH